MTKYINADRLIAGIVNQIDSLPKSHAGNIMGDGLRGVLACIDSLQQEQTELPGINGSGIPGKDFIPVEWVDACEKYGKWKIVKQEQPDKYETALEKAREWMSNVNQGGHAILIDIFPELGAYGKI